MLRAVLADLPLTRFCRPLRVRVSVVQINSVPLGDFCFLQRGAVDGDFRAHVLQSDGS